MSTEIFNLEERFINKIDKIMGMKPYLIGIVIRRRNFHSSRQVENDSLFPKTCLAPRSFHGFTNFESEVRLGLGKGFWTVFELEFCAIFRRVLVCQLTNDFGVLNGKGNGLCLRVSENDVTETGACRIVHVKDGMLGSGQSFECSPYEILSRRSKYLSSTCFQHSNQADTTKN